MPKRFFCFSLKTGAFIVSLANLLSSITSFSCALYTWWSLNHPPLPRDFYHSLFMGFSLLLSSLFLFYGTSKGHPLCIFLYLVLSSTCFFVLTVAVLVVAPKFAWLVAIVWYGQMCVNSFHRELVDARAWESWLRAGFE